MKVCLLDSDIIIEVTRGRNAQAIDAWRRLDAEGYAVACSVITVAEIWGGVRPQEKATLEFFFSSIICLPVDVQVGRLAGDLLLKYSKSHGVLVGDALIGATAIVHQVPLWTRNRKHFPSSRIRLIQP